MIEFFSAREEIVPAHRLSTLRDVFFRNKTGISSYFSAAQERVPSWRVKTEWKSSRVLHRSNTFKAIARKTQIRIVASLVILNAHAQDKIINNDPVLNRKLAGHFMDESIHNLAVTAGIATVASDDIVFDARKIVVIDCRISNLSRTA